MAISKKSGYVTIADVAQRAKVSNVSVSRFFRKPHVLSAMTKERIAEAVRALDYVPNIAAQALGSIRSGTIGVIVPSVTNTVYSDVLRGMYDAVENTPFALQLGNSRYRAEEEEHLIRIFGAQKPAGLVVTGTDQPPSAREVLRHAGLPDCPDHGYRRRALRHDDRLLAFPSGVRRRAPSSRCRIPPHRPDGSHYG